MKKTTAERLQEIMKIRNLKQVDILELCQPYAQKLGVKIQKSALSQYISGRNEPNQYRLAVLALALNVDEQWLMGYDVPITKSEMHIGEKIRQRRIELGMSQRELARKMGYSDNSTLNRIEKGMVDASQGRVIQFAKALNVSIAYLMGEEENNQINNDNSLTNDEKTLLELYRNVTEDKREMILDMIRVAVEKR